MTETIEKEGSMKKWLWIILGVVLLFIVIGAAAGDEDGATGETNAVASADDGAGDAMASAAGEDDASPAFQLSGPQNNARRSAENYVSMTGFSRKGLIKQLSSEYGDGYETGDATAAVDSLNVDWNEQAVRSAKNYLDMTGFSCNGLVEQLSSSAGDEYTVEEAKYGAQQAGAC